MSATEEEPPRYGLSRDMLEYLHEEESLRHHDKETSDRYVGSINKATALANFDEIDQQIAAEYIGMTESMLGFMYQPGKITMSQVMDNLQASLLGRATVSRAKFGLNLKLLFTQISISQSVQDGTQKGVMAGLRSHLPGGGKKP